MCTIRNKVAGHKEAREQRAESRGQGAEEKIAFPLAQNSFFPAFSGQQPFYPRDRQRYKIMILLT
ncbi:hypothetical protein [Calothrix rhizosoleniae]|uniref:hypothetical protein n=1 Tax=Calothrix rhizosoleniae TaxID=888997 RepID=UPI000B49E505|nr:hypothetical protein [Calothrix rhizosoleniae]